MDRYDKASLIELIKKNNRTPSSLNRESEFFKLIEHIRKEIIQTINGDEKKHTVILFAGSGIVIQDAIINSMVDKDKKILFLYLKNNNNNKLIDICNNYDILYEEINYCDHLTMEYLSNKITNNNVSLVYLFYESEKGVNLNKIREIIDAAHNCFSYVAIEVFYSHELITLDLKKLNVDFLFSTEQFGLMAKAGVSFLVANKNAIERSNHFVKRSYFYNLYKQYNSINNCNFKNFDPTIQTLYSLFSGIKEYWNESFLKNYKRYLDNSKIMIEKSERLGFKNKVCMEKEKGLIITLFYPKDENWNFEKIHDYCFKKGCSVYLGKVDNKKTFRLRVFKTMSKSDIDSFFKIFESALYNYKVKIPVKY